MKEITAYQSDDEKFVGIYEEVLEYENEMEQKDLINKITKQFRRYELDVGLAGDDGIIEFLQHPDVKELFYLLNS
jgi:hypothetical protein